MGTMRRSSNSERRAESTWSSRLGSSSSPLRWWTTTTTGSTVATKMQEARPPRKDEEEEESKEQAETDHTTSTGSSSCVPPPMPNHEEERSTSYSELPEFRRRTHARSQPEQVLQSQSSSSSHRFRRGPLIGPVTSMTSFDSDDDMPVFSPELSSSSSSRKKKYLRRSMSDGRPRPRDSPPYDDLRHLSTLGLVRALLARFRRLGLYLLLLLALAVTTCILQRRLAQVTLPPLPAAVTGLRGQLLQNARQHHFKSSHLHKASSSSTEPKVVKKKEAIPVAKSHYNAPPHHAVARPPPWPEAAKPLAVDRRLYASSMFSTSTDSSFHRVVYLDASNNAIASTHRRIRLYPADVTDHTQLYSVLDSHDERIKTMELRKPYAQGECVPMQPWQTTFHPSCNALHEIGLAAVGQTETDFHLFGTQGYWRNAWRVDMLGHSLVLKTLKIEHRFEEAHFEHDRIDAVAMERLTKSPHVINIFGFCGHSVVTEYADGKRLGELADKSRQVPLARLRIARDVAMGLADVHGIDGDGNATFVHLDVNPANVVSIGGTLKLNDFNIGIIRQWNTTSNEPCGFPAQYPNPQWRSPEEARNEQNLTEKVDIFALGHIFFRLICSHEPWNKLEKNGKPSKAEVNEKVKRGVLPAIPPEIMQSADPEIVAIREAMLKCYTFDPKQRPTARETANALDRALKRLEKK
jgi:Protein kinase domain